MVEGSYANPVDLEVLAIMGASGVGKSALTIRLVTNFWVGEHEATIEDRFSYEMKVDGEVTKVDVLDTAGQEEYSSLHDHWIREGTGYLLVYSITDAASFEALRTIYKKVLRVRDAESAPVVLVGNKCDLESAREVSEDDARALAAEWGCPFMEVSAKAQVRNRECFEELVRTIRRAGLPSVEPGGACCSVS